MLVIHIGTHKTGTSALQGLLTRKSDRLLKNGVRYVQSGREGANAHHELARGLRKDWDKTVWQGVRRELAESTCRINLISSEGFWFCEPEKLKEQLPEARDVRIIAYVRRQDLYLQSLYKQTVTGGRKISFAAWLGKMRHRGNYLSTIERWEAQFGREAITIRPYERGSARIDTIADFASFLGCELVEERKKGKIGGNPSPRRELLHFIRAFNTLDLEVDREEFFYSLIQKNSEYIRSTDLLTASESVALMQEYAEENRVLAERYYANIEEPLFPEMEQHVSLPNVWSLNDREFLGLTADVIDVIVRLAAEGKIRSRPNSNNPELVAGSDDQDSASGQTRQAAGNAAPKRRRQ